VQESICEKIEYVRVQQIEKATVEVRLRVQCNLRDVLRVQMSTSEKLALGAGSIKKSLQQNRLVLTMQSPPLI
jgi:hypothetical protein